ncbi:LysM peptidoglycan-binding domain-containing protein [Dialister micraerophilus]|uniref:LysM peptidoglycan-binding domain-containing protein n=1 Tax=Dialister micraerophilus TaxID=309120 RepID=UPI0023F54BCB|nr:LysM domain-containing protein [Dialister micraerophilus]
MNKALILTAMLAVSTLCAGVAVNGSLVKDYLTAGPNELIEYRKEIKSGDTLWNICSEIATDKEDLRKLVWQAMKDNHITDPAELQPGRVIIVRVREARKE